MDGPVLKVTAGEASLLRDLKRVHWSEPRPTDLGPAAALVALGLAEGEYRKNGKAKELARVRRTPAGEAYCTVERHLHAPLRAKAAALLVREQVLTAGEAAGGLGCEGRAALLALGDLVRHGYATHDDGQYAPVKEAPMARKAAEAEQATTPGRGRPARKRMARRTAEAEVKKHTDGYKAYVKAQVAKDDAGKAEHKAAYTAYRNAYRDLLDHKREAGELKPAGSRAAATQAPEAPAEAEAAPEAEVPAEAAPEYDHGQEAPAA